ncbi:MAG: hypothetical protein ACKO0N_12880 [Planctomycetota bacterium]
MGSFARDGVLGLGPLPVPPQRLALPTHSNRGSFSLRGVANDLLSRLRPSKFLRETIS